MNRLVDVVRPKAEQQSSSGYDYLSPSLEISLVFSGIKLVKSEAANLLTNHLIINPVSFFFLVVDMTFTQSYKIISDERYMGTTPIAQYKGTDRRCTTGEKWNLG